MALRIIWSERALHELEKVAAFIAADSPAHAALTVSHIIGRFHQAAEFPNSGRVVPEFGDPHLREVFWREYRLVYWVEKETIEIAAIHHGKRQLDNL